jgi:PIN domain nuclease of toxin-antitoxin system
LTIAGVADTHTALWYLYGDSRLSKRAKTFIDDAAADVEKIAVSAISLAEVVYLVEKKRVLASAYHDLSGALRDPDHVFVEEPLTADVIEAMRIVPRDAVPDMPDRIVATTAIYFRVPVISRDGMIRASSVRTIW